MAETINKRLAAKNAQESLQNARRYWEQKQHKGWEARFLSELADGPTVACYPSFTGAMHENLVAQGLATREPAGGMAHAPFVQGMYLGDKPATPASYARWCREQEPAPQFRYTITEAGRKKLGGEK